MNFLNQKPRVNWLNTTALLLATSCLTPPSAFAACTPSPATSGSTIVCSGSDTAGVGTGAEDNVKVTVNKGASIVDSGDGFAVHLNKNAQVINSGSISDTGVYVGLGSTVTNTASGKIEGVVEGLIAAGATVFNEGIITSDDTGIRLAEATLTNDGTISAFGPDPVALETYGSKILNNGDIYAEALTDVVAVFAGNFNTLTNDGLIHAKATWEQGTAIGIWGPSGQQNEIVNNDTIQVDSKGSSTGIFLIDAKIINTGDLIVNGGGATGILTNYQLDLNNSGSIIVTSDNSGAVAVIGGKDSKVVNSGTIKASGTTADIGIVAGGSAPGDMTVVNSGTIEAAVAITVTGGDTSGQYVDIFNSGLIDGAIMLGDAEDELVNTASGKVTGTIDMGDGADRVLNAGSLGEIVLLGSGDDAFFGVSGGVGPADGKVLGGAGFDTIGFYATGKASGVLAVPEDFEAAGVYVEDGAEFTILPGQSGDMFVKLYGAGKVINTAALSSFSKDHPTVEMLDDGLEFDNKGDIKGHVAVVLGGDGQTFTNDGTLFREFVFSDNTGNGGFVEDHGLGNTIINNGTISSNGFFSDAVMIGGDDVHSFTYEAVGAKVLHFQPVPTSTLINNGTISGGTDALSAGGVTTASFAPVDIINNGEISQIDTLVRRGAVSIVNAKGGVIGDGGGFPVLSTRAGINVLLGVQLTQGDFNGAVQQFKPATFTTGVDIVNQKGATIENGIQISGFASTSQLGYFGKNVTLALNIENQLGGTINANKEGIAVSIQPQLFIGDFADTVKFESVIDNSGRIEGQIVGGILADTVINRGNINGNLTLGDGHDALLLQDQSLVVGDIDGGAGTDKITHSGTNVVAGKITGIEELKVLDGTTFLDVASGSAVGNAIVDGGATLLVQGSLSGNLTILDKGTVQASGSLGNVTNHGVLSPGQGIGSLSVTGNYTQTSTGDLLMQLGTSFDQFAVTGAATLDGTLTTALTAADFDSVKGKSFTVLTAGSIAGGFDETGIVEQGFWTLDVKQSGTAVTVTVTDVDVTIGATAPVTGALAAAIAAAAPASSQGIVIEGVSNTLDVMDTNDQTATSLDYDSLGDWESTAPTFVAGWNEMGSRTPAGAMPKTGSAEFEGTTKGELTETASPEVFVVEGNVLLTANFASGLVNADFTEMEKVDSNGVTSAWVDFRARMSIADGTSEFAGTAGTDDGVWNGKARGGFYGDEGGMPGHAAGMWSMSSPLGTALGGFMARRK